MDRHQKHLPMSIGSKVMEFLIQKDQFWGGHFGFLLFHSISSALICF